MITMPPLDNILIIALIFFMFILNSIISNKNYKFFIFSLFALEGLTILLFSSHIPYYYGSALFLFSLSFIRLNSEDILTYFSLNSSFYSTSFFIPLLKKYSLLIGLLLFLFSIFLHFIINTVSFDRLFLFLIFLSFSISSFNFIPDTYSKERNFTILFITLFCFIFIVPALFLELLHYFTSDTVQMQNEINPLYSRLVSFFLSAPLVASLKILGYTVWAEGDIIFFENLALSPTTTSSVKIGKSCSGLYSVGLFITFYTTFILLEYNGKFDKIAFYLFLLGICFAYIANLIRMILIIIVGHYYGTDALLFVHNNLGWLIFTIWIFIFMRFLSSLVPTDITPTSN